MKHFNDDELVLHYYDEGGRNAALAEHLQSCAQCATAYEGIARTLTRVTLPATPEPDATLAADIWRHVRGRVARGDSQPRWAVAAGLGNAALLIWLLPLVYPFAPRAIFESARLARADSPWGLPLIALALMWAFAGPFVALFVLNTIRGERIDRVRHRLVVYGAVAATVSPALFNLTQRTGFGFPIWYAATALIALAALVPLAESTGSTLKLRRFHRTSAALILIFATAHLLNHTFAIFSVPTHSAVLGVLRVVYRQPVIEVFLFAAILLQIGSGGALVWHTHLRRPSASNNVQALSGLYLAMFFLAHVSAALLARPQTDTNFVWAAGRGGLLASRGLTYLLPYYLLGVAALLAHVGQFLRRRVFASLQEIALQRLSYAGMAFSGIVMLTIGLALCGIRLVP
jgi:hypothetical protein